MFLVSMPGQVVPIDDESRAVQGTLHHQPDILRLPIGTRLNSLRTGPAARFPKGTARSRDRSNDPGAKLANFLRMHSKMSDIA